MTVCDICQAVIRSKYDTVKCDTAICSAYAHSNCIKNSITWICKKCVEERKSELENVNKKRGSTKSEDLLNISLTPPSEQRSINNTNIENTTGDNSVNLNQKMDKTVNEAEVLSSDLEPEDQASGFSNLQSKNNNNGSPHDENINNVSNFNSVQQDLNSTAGAIRKSGADPPPPNPEQTSVNNMMFSMNICTICKKAGVSGNDLILKCLSCELYYHVSCLRDTGFPYKVMKNMLSCVSCYHPATPQPHVSFPKPQRQSKGENKDEQRLQASDSDISGSSFNQPVQKSSTNVKKNIIVQGRGKGRGGVRGGRDSGKKRSRYENNSLTENPEITEHQNRNLPNVNRHRLSVMPPNFNEPADTGVAEWAQQLQRDRIRELPVINAGQGELQWGSFYSAYEETKGHFSNIENLNRVAKAILDPKLVKIGGFALNRLESMEAALSNIDRRMASSDRMLQSYAKKLVDAKTPDSGNIQACINLMDEIYDFYTILKDIRSKTYWSNLDFISSIAKKLPTYVHNKFIESITKSRSDGYEPNYGNLAKVVEAQIPNLQTRLELEDFQQSPNNASSQFQKKKIVNCHHDNYSCYHQQEQQNLRNPSPQLEDDAEKVFKQEAFSKYCWFHKNDQHHPKNCPDLWDMDGKDVFELAKTNNICFYCGLKRHDKCPLKERMTCNVCQNKHHALFCNKRVGKKNINSNLEKIHMQYVKMMENSDSEDNEDESQNQFQGVNHHKIINDDDNFTKYNEESVSKEYINKIDQEDPEKSKKFILDQSANNILGCVTIQLKNGREMTLLVDSGSSVSMIEEKIADEAQLQGPQYKLQIQGTGEEVRDDNYSRIVRLPIKGCGIPVHVRTFKNLGIMKQRFIANEFKDYPHLKDLNLKDYDQVDGIIGIDNPEVFKRIEKFESKKENDPIGIRCPLGDYVIRVKFPLSKIYRDLTAGKKCYFNQVFCFTNNLNEEEEVEYKEAEKSALNLMEFEHSEHDRQGYEDYIALNNLKANVLKNPETHKYQASLLWKNEDMILPTARSLEIAKRRLTIIEKVTRQAKIFTECENQVHNLLKNGYAIELNKHEIEEYTAKTYYTPIFFINPPNKRIRMIWDMASKIEGTSINDYLMTGPNLYNNIVKIMFQMREEEFMIKGDLQEMFHQVEINKEDTESLRFVFRFEGERDIRHFKMLVLPFGAKCSPTIAHYVKNEVAKEKISVSPLASDIMINSTYVDDVVTSVKNKEEAIKILLELKQNFIEGGFELMKINSNSKEINEETAQIFMEAGFNTEKQFSNGKIEKILGYRVNFENDTIGVDLSGLVKIPEDILKGTDLPTKRQVLSILMSVYDPIGFFQFVISDMKILTHKIIISNPTMEWDDKIPETLHKEFLSCLEQIKEVEKVELPRSYYNKEYDTIELHAFGDASKDVLCGILFAQFKDKDEKVLASNFVHAKTFVLSKNRTRTIPELELQMAANLTDMVQFVVTNHRIKFNKVYFYSDNRAVVEWIKRGAKNKTIFMNNRLEKIKQRTEPAQWKWIPTELMPADLGTKHQKNMKITEDNDWFHPQVFNVDVNEIQVNHKVHKLQEEDQQKAEISERIYDFNKYSKYNKLVTNTQYLFRFKQWLQTKNLKTQLNKQEEDNLNAKTKSPLFALKRAEMHLIKVAQQQVLQADYNKIMQRQKVIFKKGHELRGKELGIDRYGVIHVVTRIPEKENNNKKFLNNLMTPIWIPRKSNLTKLIMLHYHEINNHIFINSTIIMLKQKYYIPSNGYVKRIIRKNCQFCKRFKARTVQPLMGDLPEDRLGVYERPFTYAMADLAGPYLTKLQRKVYAKRWILVYTCLTTRAVHLEIIDNLTSDATMVGLQIIFDIRGVPKRITTDQGTNFVGASNILGKAVEDWNKKNCIITSIEWYFNPAKAPFMSGAVEIMVGMTKTLIRKLEQQHEIDMKNISDQAFRSILNRIANMLNNRPLCALPMNENGTEYLTPNHFLMTRINQQMIPINERTKKAYLTQWKDIKEYIGFIWKKFIELYLPTLQDRKKWNLRAPNLKIGDIVIIADKDVQDSWRLGKIIKIIQGSQDQVRKVEILLGKKQIKKYKNVLNKKEILKIYKDEVASIIQRPANGVAKVEV